MDGYAFSSCDLARLAAEASGLSPSDDAGLPSEERIRHNIIQVTCRLRASLIILAWTLERIRVRLMHRAPTSA